MSTSLYAPGGTDGRGGCSFKKRSAVSGSWKKKQGWYYSGLEWFSTTFDQVYGS